jgi:hypothetical protein
MALNSVAIRNPFRELNNCVTPSQHVSLTLFNITLRSTRSFQSVLIPLKFCVETFVLFLIRTSVLHALLIQSHLAKSLYKCLVKMTREFLQYVISLFCHCLAPSVSTFKYASCARSPPIHSLPFVKNAGSLAIYRILSFVKIQGKSCADRSTFVSFKLGLLEKEPVRGVATCTSSVDFHLRDD